MLAVSRPVGFGRSALLDRVAPQAGPRVRHRAERATLAVGLCRRQLAAECDAGPAALFGRVCLRVRRSVPVLDAGPGPSRRSYRLSFAASAAIVVARALRSAPVAAWHSSSTCGLMTDLIMVVTTSVSIFTGIEFPHKR